MTRCSPVGMLLEMSRLEAPQVGLVGLLLAAAATGCTGGTETGNPVVSGSLSYTGYSSAPAEYAVGQGGDLLSVESAWFNLAPVTVSGSGCGDAAAMGFEVAALGLGDHAAGNHNSTAFEAGAGTYCSVELPFARVPEDASTGPETLRGHSILLEGALADGSAFSILSDAAPLVRLQTEANGFALSADDADTLLAFDFAVWLGDLDLAGATRTNGAIVLSADSNAERLGQFEDQLAAGIVLYRDTDADGVVDADPEELARAR